MLALHKSGKKGVNTIHSLDQSIVCEERAECGLYSKSFPMSGRPQIQKFPYGYTQGSKFIVFQNARIQTIFEDVKKAYFKFNQITMRPAYNGEELFFE